MSRSVLILFDEADLALAETLRSLLRGKGSDAHLASDLQELRPAGLALAILSPAAAGSARFRDLLAAADQDGSPILVLRLDRTPLPDWYRHLDPRPDSSFFEGPARPDARFLRHLAESLRQYLRPPRGGFRETFTVREQEIAPAKVPATYDSKPEEEAPVPKAPGSYSFDPVDPLPETRPPAREPATRSEEPPEAAPEAGRALQDKVHFSAYAPPAVAPESTFLLSIWAYLKEDREEVRERASQGGTYQEAGSKGPLRLARETELTVLLDLPAGFRAKTAAETLYWDGDVSNCDFWVEVAADLAPGSYPATAELLVGGVPVGCLNFPIRVGEQLGKSGELPTQVEWVRTIFASYSSKDRIPVLRFKQGAEASGVDVFVDVLSMRKGEDWAQRLEQEVSSRDRFCLFWSKDASESEWVEKEWRAAYKAKGLRYIHPVPLSDPRDVPPPAELGSKHFNDLAQILIAYEEQRKQARS